MDLSLLNPFNYTLAQVKVAALQVVAAIVLLLGFFIFLDPGTTAAWQAVVVAIFSCIGVFAARNPDPESVNKSLTSLVASVVGVVTLMGGDISDDTLAKVSLVIGGLIPPALVLLNRNAKKAESSRL